MSDRREHSARTKRSRRSISLVLSVLIATSPLSHAERHRNGAQPPAPAQPLSQHERVLHALNRLTFGPRPGDVAAVEAMGVDAWFERQLQPASINDAALENRLADFPAMSLPQDVLLRRYPTPQMIQRMINTNAPMPPDPVERAIYTDQIAFYKLNKERQQVARANKPSWSETPAGPADVAMGARRPMQRGARAAALADATGTGMMPGEETVYPGGAAVEARIKGAGRFAFVPGFNPDAPAPVNHREDLYPVVEAASVIELAPTARTTRILLMTPEELTDFAASLSQKERVAVSAGLNPEQKESLAALRGSPRLVGAELLQSRLLRDVYSERQLEAVMTDFWLNYFNVYIRKDGTEAFLLPAYERDVIRANALGRFEDLLIATARSPAMLTYLDNAQSIGPDSIAAGNGAKYAKFARNPQVRQAMKDRGLNENYARELMELHTVGVGCEVSVDHPVSRLDPACGPGYTQQDVTQVAAVLSGWTVDKPFEGAAYRFDERRHQPGTKHVLGKTIAEGGEREGMELLHLLATSPATAKFVSARLAVRFVSDTPSPALIEAMAKTFLDSGGDLKAVLRTMFHAHDFWSTAVYRAKVKTPIEFVVSAARATGAVVTDAQPLVASLDRLGMPLYGMQTPNGYSWMAEPWISTGSLVNRMNFSLVFTGNKIAGAKPDWNGVLAPALSRAATSGPAEGVSQALAAKERRLELVLLGQPVSDRTRSTVLSLFEDPATHRQAEVAFSQRSSPRLAPANPGALPPEYKPVSVRQPDAPELQDSQAAGMAGLLLGSPEFQRR